MSERIGANAPLKLLVELGVIILGVLIALTAESWWGQRVERRMEREYLQDLSGEMAGTDSALVSAITVDSVMAAEVQALQGVLSSEDPPPTDSAWVRGAANLAFEEVSMETGTLTTLFETGHIRLIRSRAIRVKLGSLQARLESHLPIRTALEELLYLQYQENVRQLYLAVENGSASLAKLRGSADYKAIVDARQLLLVARVYYNRQLLEAVRSLGSELSGELGEDPGGQGLEYGGAT